MADDRRKPAASKLPLPTHLQELRERSFTLFASNLPEPTSKTELEAMFCRAGRIVDSFIPLDRNFGQLRGFAFVLFATKIEANRAIEMATSRSWGGRRIVVSLSKDKGKEEGKLASSGPGRSLESNRIAFLSRQEGKVDLPTPKWYRLTR